MGLFDRWSARKRITEHIDTPHMTAAVGVGGEKDDNSVNLTFNDRNITFTGSLAGYDYDAVLRNKQKNIQTLFQLSDYFVDADPIYRGIIKEVYTPFSIADDFRLVGANEKVKQKYLDYYERIDLKKKMRSIFLQFYKYGNVYIYLMDDGNFIDLPVHYIRIANVAVNGEPVLEINCRAIRDDYMPQGVQALKDYIEDADLEVRLSGFPPEVAKGIREGKEYVQLNPANTFVMQDLKEGWMRYAIPMIATCLKPFAKKELISRYEDALINLGARSFVHVTYGDPTNEVLPDRAALSAVQGLFRSAMTGGALAVTNNWCDAKVIQPKTDDMFEYDKYKGVNADILSAGGISGIIVSGRSEDGSTFASAQVSMQTAAMRIKQAKDQFCTMMNKINRRLNESSIAMPHSAREQIPKFTFPPVDLAGSKAFQDACLKLWEKGVVSSETLLQTYGYDMKQEVERRNAEEKQGINDALESRTGKAATEETDESKIGRPEMDDSERHSDPANAMTGKQPKPSNPEGSL